MEILNSPVHRAEIIYISIACFLTAAFGIWHYHSRNTTAIGIRITASLWMICALLVSYNIFHLAIGNTDPHVWYCILVLVCFTGLGIVWLIYCNSQTQQQHELFDSHERAYSQL